MKVSFQYPERNGSAADFFAPGPWEEVAVKVEMCGLDAISISEHIIPGARWLEKGGHQTVDPFVALAYAGAVTTRLRLLTYLAVAPYRNPFALAKAAATLDRLSGGRMILGLGTGYQKSEFFALGVDIDERNALFDEALDVLPLHWSGNAFSYEGRHFNARDVRALPAPIQDPIPIWIGGNSKLTRHRVAQRAQGWMPLPGDAVLSATARTPYLGTLDEIASAMTEIREAALASGRTEPIDLVYSYNGASGVMPHVDPDRHLETLARAEAAGATWIVLNCGARDQSWTFDWLESFSETCLQPRDKSQLGEALD